MSKKAYFSVVFAIGVVGTVGLFAPKYSSAQVVNNGLLRISAVDARQAPIIKPFFGHIVSVDDQPATTSIDSYYGPFSPYPEEHWITFTVPPKYTVQYSFCSYQIGDPECVSNDPIGYYGDGWECVGDDVLDCPVRRLMIYATNDRIWRYTFRYAYREGRLQIYKKGDGAGTVTRTAGLLPTATPFNPPVCGTFCLQSFAPGMDLTLKAEPSASSTFAGWSESTVCSGVEDCTFSSFDNQNVTAIFNLKATSTPATTTPSGASSVLFIPGLEGSALYHLENGTEKQLWFPGFASGNADVQKLFLNEMGSSTDPAIYTKNILIKPFGVPVYDGFINYLNKLKQDSVIKSWEAFPYDWRMGLSEIVSLSPLSLSSLGCSPSNLNPFTNQVVTWTVSTSPQNTNYTYAWSGSFVATTTQNTKNISYPIVGPQNTHVKVLLGSKTLGETDCVPLTVKLPPIFESIGKVFSLKIQDQSFSFAGAQLRNSTAYLDSVILSLASTSNSQKVTIVAHSYGGLVAKALIKRLQDEGRTDILAKIDRVILVAVPQLGTPDAIAALLHGDKQEIGKYGLNLIESSTMRDFGENMQGAYNLLPSQEYFNKISDKTVIEFEPSASSTLAQLYGASISSYQGMRNFLQGLLDKRKEPVSTDLFTPNKLKQTLLDTARESHLSIDSFVFPSSIDVIQIAGWGNVTVQGVDYVKGKACFPKPNGLAGCVMKEIMDHKPIPTINGDGTVYSPSVFVYDKKYYLDLRLAGNQFEHKDIFEALALQTFIKNLLVGTSSLPIEISTSAPIQKKRKKFLGLLSPAKIDAFDQNGLHTGVSTSTINLGFTDDQIPGSSYMEFGEGKYLSFEGEDVKVVLSGTDTGTFTLEYSEILNDVSTTTRFTDLPVTPALKTTLDYSQSIPKLNLDIEGDGKIDFVASPSVESDPLLYGKMLQSIVKNMKLYSSVQDSILEDLADATKEIKDKDFDDAREIRNDIRKDLLDLDWKSTHITAEQRSLLLSLLNSFIIGGNKDPLSAIILVEDIESTVRGMILVSSVKDSMIDKLEDIKENLEKEDIGDAKGDAEGLLKNLNDAGWKTGMVSSDQRSAISGLVQRLVDQIRLLK